VGAAQDEAEDIDWQTLIESAAECGMTEREFWSSTPRWLAARQTAYQRAQQAEWERTRIGAFYIVKTVDSKNRFKKPEDLFKFPWEQPKAEAVQSAPLTAQEQADFEKFSREADEWYYSKHPEKRPKTDGISQ